MNKILFIILTVLFLFVFNGAVIAQTEPKSVPEATQTERRSVPEVTQTMPQPAPEEVQKEKKCIPETVQAETQPASETAQESKQPSETWEEPSLGIKIVDILLVRPLCAVGSTISTVTFIAVSPLVSIIGVGEEAARYMVEAPWRFTSFRYVGQFNHYKDEQPIMGVWDFL
ncbi:MAG: hypothetical protein A4E66_02446 [Syntrophus sp. PtaB.Bin001]|jgi:hypothetical protein|nr:MAG: hypothetical protein A4E66_02446 [Syntrophus sp. PtaB.Bin001]